VYTQVDHPLGFISYFPPLKVMIMMRVPAAYFDILTTVPTSILTVLVLKKLSATFP